MKFAISLTIIFLVGLSFYFFTPQIDFAKKTLRNVMEENVPEVVNFFDYVTDHKNSNTDFGVSFYTTLLSTSFITQSLDDYVQVLKENITKQKILLLVPLFATLGSFINYVIGYTLGDKAINYVFGGISGFTEDILEHAAWLLVFVSALLPFPDITSLVIGTHKVNPAKFLMITLIGKSFHVLNILYNPNLIIALVKP